MTRALRSVLLVVACAAVCASAACKKTPATCKDLSPAIEAWGKAELASEKLAGEAAQKRLALFALTADLYPRVCESSKWSGETIDCLIAARTEEDAQKCPLTKDQRDDLQKALMDALTGAAAKPK